MLTDCLSFGARSTPVSGRVEGSVISLKDLIVCPICHADLPLDAIARDGAGCCSRCGSRYHFQQGVYNLTPVIPPDDILKSRWATWQILQENGSLSYTSAPEFNLSVGQREDALAFQEFSHPSGLILDIGCGPQEYPSYLPNGSDVVGIDPLLGQQPRGFAFVQGVGEYLPFRNHTFDHILYATSLDHIIDPHRSLADAHRCLKPDGVISLWIDSQAPDFNSGDQSRWGRYGMLIKKGVRSLTRHGWLREIGLRRTLGYIGSVARMNVPEGAIDYFHFEHLTVAAVSGWLDDIGLTIMRQQEYAAADSLFVQAARQANRLYEARTK